MDTSKPAFEDLFPPLVISDVYKQGGVEPVVEDNSSAYYSPEPTLVPFIEGIGGFIVDRLNRCTSGFGGWFLIHNGSVKEMRKGKLVFTLQQNATDEYRAKDLDRIVMKITLKRNWHLWPRFCRQVRRGLDYLRARLYDRTM